MTSAYADIASILSTALAHGGGEVECASGGMAVSWRHRAYRYRKALREESNGEDTSLDAMLLTVRGKNVVIEFSAPRLLIDGKPVPLQKAADLTPAERAEVTKLLANLDLDSPEE